jgi:hypothetical protein
MRKKYKILLIGIISISSFAGLIIFSLEFLPISNQEGKNTGRTNRLSEVHNITLIVEYITQPTDSWDNFSLYDYNTSVLDALEEKCSVGLSIFSSGPLVISINGVGPDWVYYVNGQFAGVGAADYYLSNGDNIHWKRVNV